MSRVINFNKKERNIFAFFSAFVLTITCIFLITFYSNAASSTNNTIKESVNSMQIHFIDVGQGNSVLIQSKDCNMLIDAGDSASGYKVVNYLDNLKITKLNYVIATHAHEDHIGGMTDIINSFIIDTFILPSKKHNTDVYFDMLEALDANNISVTYPKFLNTYSLGYGEFTIISPIVDSTNISLNNSSITLKIKNKNNSFIIGGDIEKKQELNLLNQDIDLSADLLLLNHHGSKTSNCLEYLQAVNPNMAIISVGSSTQYHMPSLEIINRLNTLNIPYYTTHENGTIIATSNGESIEYKTLKKEKHQ